MPQPRSGWGACTALLLGALCGCSALAPLDGLTSGDASPDHSIPGDDAATEDASGDAPADGAATIDAGFEASSTPDAADLDSQPPGDGGEAGDTSDAGHGAEGGPTDAGGEGSAPPSIAFVQIGVATPQTPQTQSSVTAGFGNAQSAGDLNVVVVGWFDTTSTIATVTDTAGNKYTLAIGPTQYAPDLTQSIYYAPNIHGAAAGTNKVTVTFSQAANLVDLRVLEYSGLDTTSPLDVATAGTGNNAGPAASAAATTSHARELLVGGGMSSNLYKAAGASFTMRATTPDGDMVEDRVVSATGVYTANATLNASCEWIMQLAAFH